MILRCINLIYGFLVSLGMAYITLASVDKGVKGKYGMLAVIFFLAMPVVYLYAICSIKYRFHVINKMSFWWVPINACSIGLFYCIFNVFRHMEYPGFAIILLMFLTMMILALISFFSYVILIANELSGEKVGRMTNK